MTNVEYRQAGYKTVTEAAQMLGIPGSGKYLKSRLLPAFPRAVRGPARTDPWWIPKQDVLDYAARKGIQVEETVNKQPEDNQEWYTIVAAARATKRHDSVIRRALQNGTIKAEQRPTKFGTKLMMAASELDKIRAIPEKPRKAKRSRKLDGVGDAILALTKPNQLPGDMQLVKKVAKQIGYSTGAVYSWAKKGLVPGREIQTGPKSRQWVISLSGAKAKAEELRGKGHKSSLKTIAHIAAVTPNPNGLLTQKLLDMAEIVRTNPMVVVESCDVVLRFKG